MRVTYHYKPGNLGRLPYRLWLIGINNLLQYRKAGSIFNFPGEIGNLRGYYNKWWNPSITAHYIRENAGLIEPVPEDILC